MLLALHIEEDRRRLEMVLLLVLLYNILHWLAIVQPRESPWVKLYMSAEDWSFLHMTGLNRQSFSVLLESSLTWNCKETQDSSNGQDQIFQ